MQAIQVTSWAEDPRVLTVSKPPAPSPSQIQLRMQVVGLHAVVRMRAAGTHYSASTLPHRLGTDGVGVDEATGTRYYVLSMASDFGTAADYINVERQTAVPLPEGADAIAIAANVNPGMSSWLALATRTSDLAPGFTVLILGATSASGQLAVPLSRILGAGRVVGVARSAAALESVEGLDRRIELKPGSETDYSGLEDVDVVLDYVGGDTAVQLLRSLPVAPGKPVQYVQIGTLGGEDTVNIPVALLRSKNLTLRGSGPGAFPLSEFGRQTPRLVEALASLPLKQPQKFPIDQFDAVWGDQSLAKKGRIVLTF